MAKLDALAIDQKNEEELLARLRNGQIDFTGQPNLAVQTGNRSIPEMIRDFERAGRAIMVAEADANFPEIPGLPLYPDKLEAILLERSVTAELDIARLKLAREQELAAKNAEANQKKNNEELEKLRALAPKEDSTEPPKG